MMTRKITAGAAALSLFLAACAPLSVGDHRGYPTTTVADPSARWLDAKSRYSGQMETNIEFAKRCHASLAMQYRGCQAAVNELNDEADLAQDALEQGNRAERLNAPDQVDSAISDIDTVIGFMRETIRNGG